MMARSLSDVRQWLAERRYETESYDPLMEMQQAPDAASTVTWRYSNARASWSPQITITETATALELPAVDMPSNRVDSITNKVQNVIAQNEERIHHLESNEPSQDNHRNRLATVSVPPNTVSNNVKKFHNTLLLPQQSQTQIKNNEEIILRKALPQFLKSGLLMPSIPQRPHSHNETKQNSYLYQNNVSLPIMIREGPISRVKIMTATNKSPKHWKTGMYALLTDQALFFFDDADALLSMKSGAASTSIPTVKDRVDLRNGARIVQDTDRHHSTKRNVLAISSRDGLIAALMQNDDQQLSDIWYKEISSVIAKHMKDSADSPTGSGVTNTKSVLNWFFKKRPNKETLVNQGIYKNEPIFGNTLERLYEASDKKRLIPAFVVRCTEILENPPHVFSIGLYRTSGNLSHIQKWRLRVDQEDAEALEDLALASDSDVLAGALKLFFRELQIPLVPYHVYLLLSEACTQQDSVQRFNMSIDALKKLPQAHYQTLSLLCKHLLSVTVHERQNQMSAANLGIVWGPSFTWPEEGSATRALHLCTDVNRVVQYLIEESGKLFP